MITVNNKYGESIIFNDNVIGNTIASNILKPPQSYPGVSKILNETSDMSFLERWRNNIGDEEADRIVNESIEIGKSFDMIMFEYFKGTDVTTMINEPAFNLYRQSSKYLKNIDPIALQLQVFSTKLQMQGYIDCLCYYKGKLSILDFKNSRKYKHDDHLEGYYKQCTYYAMMLWDMYGIKVTQIVLFIGMRNHVYPDIRIEKTKSFVKDCLYANKKYYLTNQINSDTV